jgi:nucleoside-diphosphate-sugar epimerase
MKIVITGGSGFIGTCLAESLLRDGHDVVIFDKCHSKAFSERCIVGDVRKIDVFEKALQGAETVYHLAAEHADDVRPASLYYDVNVGGASNLVSIATKRDIKRIIFTSTVALYGLNVGIPNESSPVQPFNDYGKSKYEAEEVFRGWADKDKDRCAVFVRPVVIFGEGNRGNVFNLLNQIATGKFFMIGKGQNKKSMGYVQNIASFLTMLSDHEPGVHIYNYADKPDLTTQELVSIALKSLNRENSITRIPYWAGLAGGYCFDVLARLTGRNYPISSIRIKKFCANTQVSADKVQQSGFRPHFTISDGLERMIKVEF